MRRYNFAGEIRAFANLCVYEMERGQGKRKKKEEKKLTNIK